MTPGTKESRRISNFWSELLYIRFALRHIESRLKNLRPGVNTNFNAYNKLIDERLDLTSRLETAILNYRECSFYEDTKLFHRGPFMALLRMARARQFRVIDTPKGHCWSFKTPTA